MPSFHQATVLLIPILACKPTADASETASPDNAELSDEETSSCPTDADPDDPERVVLTDSDSGLTTTIPKTATTVCKPAGASATWDTTVIAALPPTKSAKSLDQDAINGLAGFLDGAGDRSNEVPVAVTHHNSGRKMRCGRATLNANSEIAIMACAGAVQIDNGQSAVFLAGLLVPNEAPQPDVFDDRWRQITGLAATWSTPSASADAYSTATPTCLERVDDPGEREVIAMGPKAIAITPPAKTTIERKPEQPNAAAFRAEKSRAPIAVSFLEYSAKGLGIDLAGPETETMLDKFEEHGKATGLDLGARERVEGDCPTYMWPATRKAPNGASVPGVIMMRGDGPHDIVNLECWFHPRRKKAGPQACRELLDTVVRVD